MTQPPPWPPTPQHWPGQPPQGAQGGSEWAGGPQPPQQPWGQPQPWGAPPYAGGQPQQWGQPWQGQQFPPPQMNGYGAPMYAPAPPPPRPRHPMAQLGNFRWMDLVNALVYIALMFFGVLALLLYIPGVRELFHGDRMAAGFALNLANDVIMVTLVMITAGREFFRSFRTFLWWPWAKFFGIPGAWLVNLLTTAIAIVLVRLITGQSSVTQSANQQTIDEMMKVVPMPLMVLLVVVMGPLVEEYFFRHLFIGKLSRWINVWILLPISALGFMALHFIGSGEMPTATTGMPYFVMGLTFGAAYILSGKSYAYSYTLHAFSNAMALLLSSAVTP